MRRHRKVRYTLECLDRRLSPSHVVPPPADFGPIDFGPIGDDDGKDYPGDFPPFVPIYFVEVGPAGPAF